MTLEQRLNAIAGNLIMSPAQKNNINNTFSELRNKINRSPEFSGVIKGGSIQRNKLVRGISDIDVYVEYLGDKMPQAVLGKLKSHLEKEYPHNDVRQDNPSIAIDLNRITIEITPYKQNKLGGHVIPSDNIQTWIETDFFSLRKQFSSLDDKNNHLNNAIVLLKAWNSKNKMLSNYEIEKRMYSQYNVNSYQSASHYIHTFFKSGNFSNEATVFQEFIDNQYSGHYPMNQKLNSFFGIQ